MAHVARSAVSNSSLELLDGPALTPPNGVIPNVTNQSEEQRWYYVAASFCTVFPGALLLLRLYTKLHIMRKVDLTDYIVVVAFLLFLVMIILGRPITNEGAAVHQWNLQLKHLIKLQYWDYVAQILYGPTMFLVKMAILLQYLRLFAPSKTVNPVMFIGARVIIAITGVYYIITTFITMFACTPREKIWNPLVMEGHCLNNDIGILFTCIFNVITDILILVLPARSVWRLQIPRRKKIGIVLLFAIGLLACFANAMIFIYTLRMGGPNGDVSYNTAWQGFWVFAEISLGLIVTCTLTLPRFIEAEGKQLRALISKVSGPFGSLVRLTRFTSSTGTTTKNKVSTNYPRRLGTEMDPETGDRSFEALRDVEGWSNVSGYPIH